MSWNQEETQSISRLRRLSAEIPTLPALAEVEQRLFPGTRVGRYLILYPVGAGGMGEVYAAFDPQLDRKVAIKLALGKVESRPQLPQRREGKILARLRHPNVVAVHDVGEHEGRMFIAMEFVDGPTLGEWLTGNHPWREVVGVFLQAGRGLAAIHQAQLVHQDFKPGNAMVGVDGEVRIVDFGLARGQDASQAPLLGAAKSSQPGGTPGYIAPERLGGRPADARSDQYSFCVALWRALYGHHPSSTDEVSATKVPGWLRQTLLRGLSETPEDRFPSMEDLLEALSPKRRSARTTRWAAVAALLTIGALTAGSMALRPAPAGLCGGAEEHLEGIWDDDHQNTIQQAFGRAGTFGVEAFLGLQPTLDAYAQGWVAMRTEACEATHIRGEQSQRLLDMRMICLDDRLEEFRALTGVLADADRQLVVRGLPAVTHLRSLSDCADRPELILLSIPDLDAEERAEANRIRTVMEEQIALYETGRENDASLGIVEELLESLARLGGYPSLEARALELLGNLRFRHSSDLASAETAYQRALIAAIESGDRNEQARLLGLLAGMAGYEPQGTGNAQLWSKLAEATLTALGPGHEETRFYVLRSLSNVAFAARNYEQAKARARRALELGEVRWGPESPKLLTLLSSLAITLDQGAAGVESEGERSLLLERALKIGETAYGPSHPLLNPLLYSLGSSYAHQGRSEKALELAKRSLEMKQLGRHSLAYPLLLSTHALILQDRPAEASSYGERAVSIVEQEFGKAHWLLARAYHSLGEIALLELRIETARENFAKASQIIAAAPEIDPESTDYAMVFQNRSLGKVHLALDQYDQARVVLERARDSADERHPYQVHLAIHLGLGEALLGLGQPRQARRLLEDAIELGIPAADAVALGEARFALARALWPNDRKTARDLASTGRQGLARGKSPRSRMLLAAVESWLVTHAPDRPS